MEFRRPARHVWIPLLMIAVSVGSMLALQALAQSQARQEPGVSRLPPGEQPQPAAPREPTEEERALRRQAQQSRNLLLTGRIDSPVDAASLMFTDLITYYRGEFGRENIRYIWWPSWVPGGYGIASQFLNEVVSTNANIIPPRLISRDGVHVVVVDFLELNPDPDDRANAIAVWNKFESTYFPFKQAALDTFNLFDGLEETSETIDPYIGQLVEIRDSKGVWHQWKYLRADGVRVQVAWPNDASHTGWVQADRIRYPRLDAETVRQLLNAGGRNDVATLQNQQLLFLGDAGQKLPGLTDSEVPAIRLDEMVRQGWTSLDTDGFEGLYYEFERVEPIDSPRRNSGATNRAVVGALTFDEVLEEFGVDPRDTNVTEIPLPFSKVTGHGRIVQLFYGNQSRPGETLPLFTSTLDIVGEQRHLDPVDNIVEFKKKALARRTIGIDENGTPVYFIFNDQQLLDSVPDNVADNDEIPRPYDDRLAAGVGCIYCHQAKPNSYLYLPAPNLVRDLLRDSPEYRAFIDSQELLGTGTDQQFNNIQAADDILSLQTQRRALARKIADLRGLPRNRLRQLEALNQFEFDDVDVNDVVDQDFTRIEEFGALFNSRDVPAFNAGRLFFDRNIRAMAYVDSQTNGYAIVSMLNDYEYAPVTAQVQLRDIGLDVPETISVPVLRDVLGISAGVEDPRFAAAKLGAAYPRGVWERKYLLFVQRTATGKLRKDGR